MEMREQILSSAQQLVQQRGFNGFSYADIADEVGIRKASLHYYFPTKTDLVLALVADYTTQLDNELSRIGGLDIPADAKLEAYFSIMRGTLESKRMCLCGMLASEVLTLDPVVLPGLQRFFARNVEWLTEVLAAGYSRRIFVLTGTAAEHARMLLSSLQGALLLARATGDREAFYKTLSLLLSGLSRKG